MSIYSAAIIGASPAGCIAAIALARKGLNVLLIDPSEFPRDRADISSPLNIERSAWLGCRTWRSLRNQSLKTVAQTQGVEVWRACRVDAAIIEQGQLMGLTTERGTVRAYHILDASGQRQWLARQLGIRIKRSSPKLMAQFETWQMRDRFAGPGWFLLGEAAASPDLATSCGWLRALAYRLTHKLQAAMSGLQVAHEIADCEHEKFQKHSPPSATASGYRPGLSKVLLHSAAENTLLMRIHGYLQADQHRNSDVIEKLLISK